MQRQELHISALQMTTTHPETKKQETSNKLLPTLHILESSRHYRVHDYVSDDRKKRFVLSTCACKKQHSNDEENNSDRRVLLQLSSSGDKKPHHMLSSASVRAKKVKLRQMIYLWAFRVVDEIEVDRAIVVFFASLLDQFMTVVRCSKEGFRLASMAALIVTFKLHRPREKCLSMDDMVLLSDSQCTKRDIEEMELIFLDTLFWRVSGPTPLCFLHVFVADSPYKKQERNEILLRAEYLIELSVLDIFFCNHKPSVVALASYLIATRGGATDVFNGTNIEPDWSEVCDVKQKLSQAIDPIIGIKTGGTLITRLRGL